MSNNLFDITTSSTNTTNDTYTLSDNLTNIINIKDNLGNIIPYNIDLTNNYIYWLFGINDLSYNITTTVDINNLGFVIAGDCNNYPSVCTLDTDYYPFSVITDCIWPGEKNALYAPSLFVIGANTVIVSKYSNARQGPGLKIRPIYEQDLSIYATGNLTNYIGKKTLNYTAYNNEYDSNGLQDTEFSYVPITKLQNNGTRVINYFNFDQLKKVPSTNTNIMSTKISSYPGACGGITSGNIRQFTTTQNIQIYKKHILTTNDISLNYILKYSNTFNEITTTSAVINNNNGGSGTSIKNNEIECTSFNVENVENGNPTVDIITQQLPSSRIPNQTVIVESNVLTNTCQIPFILDNNLATNFNMHFDNLSKNIIINGSGISENHQINYSYTGTQTINVYNWGSRPYLRRKWGDGLNSYLVESETPTYSKQNLSIINYPYVTFGSPLSLNDRAKGKKQITEFKPVLAKGSSNFALVYYNFSNSITITKNITTLNIDLAIASRITLDLSSITYSNVNYNFIYTLRVNNLNKLTVISGSLNSNSKIFDIVYNYVGGKQKKVTWYINIIA